MIPPFIFPGFYTVKICGGTALGFLVLMWSIGRNDKKLSDKPKRALT